jgi:hypothetical protein
MGDEADVNATRMTTCVSSSSLATGRRWYRKWRRPDLGHGNPDAVEDAVIAAWELQSAH